MTTTTTSYGYVIRRKDDGLYMGGAGGERRWETEARAAIDCDSAAIAQRIIDADLVNRVVDDRDNYAVERIER